MDKIVRHISLLLLLCVLFAFAACEKRPVNGDLDGQWQLVGIERDGVFTPGDGRYLRIQLDVAQLARSGWVPYEGTGKMTHTGDVLTIDFVNCHTAEDLAMLQAWGVYENPSVYKIEELTSKRLVLKAGNTKSTWRKF